MSLFSNSSFSIKNYSFDSRKRSINNNIERSLLFWIKIPDQLISKIISKHSKYISLSSRNRIFIENDLIDQEVW